MSDAPRPSGSTGIDTAAPGAPSTDPAEARPGEGKIPAAWGVLGATRAESIRPPGATDADAGDGAHAPGARDRAAAGELRARIEEAMRIVDAQAPAGARPDYVLNPLQHAVLFEQAAPELAERLRGSDLRVSAESYVERDARASGLQAEFRRKSARARNSALLSSVAASLLVASAGAALIPGLPRGALDGAVILLSVVTVVTGALAAGWIQAIRGSTLLERWMKRRAEAETERSRFFQLLVLETRLENPLLQLEYFRRFQLDVQRAYFDSRGEQQRRSADRQILVVAMATAVAGIATGVAGVLGASVHPAWISLAAFGLVAQAFIARAESRLASDQSVRNADRYEQTRVSLDEFYRLLDRVRTATAAAGADGDLSVMREYVTAVHDRLAEEHRQWLDDVQTASGAVARLEAMIEDSQRKVRGG